MVHTHCDAVCNNHTLLFHKIPLIPCTGWTALAAGEAIQCFVLATRHAEDVFTSPHSDPALRMEQMVSPWAFLWCTLSKFLNASQITINPLCNTPSQLRSIIIPQELGISDQF